MCLQIEELEWVEGNLCDQWDEMPNIRMSNEKKKLKVASDFILDIYIRMTPRLLRGIAATHLYHIPDNEPGR